MQYMDSVEDDINANTTLDEDEEQCLMSGTVECMYQKGFLRLCRKKLEMWYIQISCKYCII